jgi:iron donor protein CyaY
MASITETEFHDRCGEDIARLQDALEEQDTAGLLDIDGQDGMLTVKLEDGKTFVVSRHTAARELWLSSPVSGGHHFRPTDGGWVLPDGRRFPQMFLEELNRLAGREFHD